MGLAASQARLLTITARKADCEFMSMSLSHQKLALARDMEKVSAEYQDALTKTKLVYDYYGSGTGQMDLSYGLLMEPSIYNDYVPKLLTDQTNRVILNSQYAAAAAAAGIPAEGLNGTPSSNTRNKFIEALRDNGIITATRAETILGVTYNNAIGLGAGVSVTQGTEEITFDKLMEKFETYSMGDAGMENIFTGEDVGVVAFGTNSSGTKSQLGWPARLGITDASGNTTEIKETDKTENLNQALSRINGIKLNDLLNGDVNYYLSAQSAKGELTPISGLRAFQAKLLGTSEADSSFLNWLQDSFAEVLGGTGTSNMALDYAYNAVFDLLNPDGKFEEYVTKAAAGDPNLHIYDQANKSRCSAFDDHNSEISATLASMATNHPDGRKDDGDYYPKLAEDSNDYISFLYTQEWDGNGVDRNDRSQVAINLNNLAKVFLTAYVQYMEGVGESTYHWNVGKLSDSNLYNPNTDDFKFTVVTDTTIDTGDSYLYAGFYDTIFNRICINGWCTNDNIDNKDYMGELLKSGMAFISTMSSDGFYYQGNYGTDKTILEVQDQDAIAKAQAKYNTEKSKIEFKEDRIDLKMKNLDTEISSLTTEYDTTKQLLGKVIEKSFKRYDA